MLACGDLDASEEYFNPVIFDFLLFASEAALGAPAGGNFPIGYDDVSIITSRRTRSPSVGMVAWYAWPPFS